MYPNASIIPSAPVLKFPIPLKVANKPMPEAKAAAKPSPHKDQVVSQSTSQKQDLKAIYEWAQKLTDNPDVRTLPRKARKDLLDGPTAPLLSGDKIIGVAPLRLMVAASNTIRSELLKTKEIPSIRAAHPALSAALVELVEYLKKTLTRYNCYFLKTTNFEHDVDLILASESLGMDIYTANVRNAWWAYLNRSSVEEIGFEDLKVLETRMVPQIKKFKMTDMLVKRLSHQWYDYKIADLAQFEEWMTKLPKMLAAMNEYVDLWDTVRAEKKDAIKEKQLQNEKESFDEQLRAARGGRAGGYGM